MVIFLYNLFVIWVGIWLGPWLLLKRRTRYGLMAKLGAVPKNLKRKYATEDSRRPLWFHAVSVGEINAGLPLILKLAKEHPYQPIVVSTTTGAGHKHAVEKLGNIADCFYFPFDVSWAVNAYLSVLKPRLVTIIETEIWPGFMTRCEKMHVPTAMVNGRMSPRSFRNYNAFKMIFGPILRKFTAIGVQTSTEENRYKQVAGNDLNVRVLGNIKFDGLKPLPAAEISDFRQKLNLQRTDKVFVAGSTHDGEETAVLNAYKEVCSTIKTKLVIAPRHPERFDKVAEIITASGFRPRRFSLNETFENDNDVFVLDAIGHLMKFYALADVAFVGGTLAPIGGHNLMEPYTYCVPVIAGPQIHKTKDIADALQNGEAIVFIKDEHELPRELHRLLNNDGLRKQLGTRGNAILTQSQGAVDRAADLLAELVDLSAYQDSVPARTPTLHPESDMPSTPAEPASKPLLHRESDTPSTQSEPAKTSALHSDALSGEAR